MSETLWFEDLEAGTTFSSRKEAEVDEPRLKVFAAEFDPQPFHLDESAARASVFGELVASGWHTAALTMKLLVEGALPIGGGLVGVGVDELRWPAPVRPGDRLRVEGEVTESRPSRSGASRGIVTMRVRTRNQDGAVVQEMVAKVLVPQRPAGSTLPGGATP